MCNAKIAAREIAIRHDAGELDFRNDVGTTHGLNAINFACKCFGIDICTVGFGDLAFTLQLEHLAVENRDRRAGFDVVTRFRQLFETGPAAGTFGATLVDMTSVIVMDVGSFSPFANPSLTDKHSSAANNNLNARSMVVIEIMMLSFAAREGSWPA